MSTKKPPGGQSSRNRAVSEARQAQKQREKSYRERALKMYPHICGRCSREFSGKKLRELTVHHRDHNHDHNPPDGSNWELLCIYCHENEHSRHLEADAQGPSGAESETAPGATHRPFADLAALLNQKQKS